MDMCLVPGPSKLDASGRITLPDSDALDKAAASLESSAQSFRTDIEGAAGTWQGLAASYVSEESDTVLAAFGKVTPLAVRVDQDATSVAGALTAFSATCRELQLRLDTYGRQVLELDADIKQYPTVVEEVVMVHGEQVTRLRHQSWEGDAGLSGRRQVLADDFKAIHDEYLRAQDDCAQAMAGVSGSYTRSSERPVHPDLRSGNFVTEFLYDAGKFLGIEHGDDWNAWGEQTVPFRANGVLGEIQGFGAGALELVDGVVSLVPGLANPTKFGNTWEGIGRLITDPGSIDFGAAFSESLHLDDLGTNGHWAAGTLVFNGASLLVPGGVAAKSGAGVSKLGSIVGRAGTAAERLGGATGKAGSVLNTASHLLSAGGTFLSRPGALGAKISGLMMPRTTEAILDALGRVKAAAWETTVVRTLEGGSALLKHLDGGGSPGELASLADGLDRLGNKVRVDHVIPDSAPRYPPNVFVDKAGNPVRVVLDDGTVHHVATRRDQISQLKTSLDPTTWDAPDEFLAKHLSASEFAELATHRGPDGAVPGDILELKVAEILHRSLDSADDHGIHLEAGKKPLEQALAPLAKRFYYDLSDEQADLVHDLRHMMGTGDADTWYQKVMSVEDGVKTLAGTDRFPGTAGGFISKASDTADLRTVDEVILGLRLDYRLKASDEDLGYIAYKIGEVDEIVAIRFQTKQSARVEIPDRSNSARIAEIGRNSIEGADLSQGHLGEKSADTAVWPNTGHAFTSSRVSDLPVVPELKILGGVEYGGGAEMWRIDKMGAERLAGIFDGESWIEI